jgi:hypothetical protein
LDDPFFGGITGAGATGVGVDEPSSSPPSREDTRMAAASLL